MILQFSTGGRSGAGKERGGMLALKPDMASLATGSCNFPTRVYENSPDLVDWLAAEMLAHDVKPEIEAFDLSMIFKAVEMEQAGKIKGPLHVQFVMGVKNAMPVDREVFEFYVATLKRLAPDATWTGAGIGKDQLTLNRWSLELGGHCRTGPRGQCALGQDLAGALQRRAGRPRGRAVRRVWPAAGDGGRGARAAAPAAGGVRRWRGRAGIFGPLLADAEVAAILGDAGAGAGHGRGSSVALAEVEGRLGVIDPAAAAAIEAAPRRLRARPRTIWPAAPPRPACRCRPWWRSCGEQVGGEAASFVHWGATSQDILDTALVLQLREALALLDGGSTRLIAALARLADAHRATPIIGPDPLPAGGADHVRAQGRRAGWRRCCAIASGWPS